LYSVYDKMNVKPPKITYCENYREDKQDKQVKQVTQTTITSVKTGADIQTVPRALFKSSFHVYVNGHVFNDTEIMKKFIIAIKPSVRHSQYIDMNAYRPFGLMRMPYTYFKCPEISFEYFQSCIITAGTYGTSLPNVLNFTQNKVINFDKRIMYNSDPYNRVTEYSNDGDFIADLQWYAWKYFDQSNEFEYRDHKVEDEFILFSFNRTGPSMCMLCCKEHEKDNTMMAIINRKTKNLIIKCRHFNVDNPKENGKVDLPPITEKMSAWVSRQYGETIIPTRQQNSGTIQNIKRMMKKNKRY